MYEIVWSALGVFLLIQWLTVIRDGLEFEKKAALYEPQNLPPLTDYPLVSVVVPARNEELHIEQTLTSLKNQNYPNFEVIMINDRSSDRTGEIMRGFSSLPGWRALSIQQLPSGWLGKNHALHWGAVNSTGQFILFTDGDILFKPETLKTAVHIASAKKMDHLLIAPRFISSGALLEAMQAFFSVIFLSMLKPGRIGTSSKYYIGAGAFNFVRRSHYEKVGGHERLRMEIIDDVMLGKIMIEAGGHSGFSHNTDLVSVEWYSDWRAMILGLEKNGFAAMKFSVLQLAKVVTLTFLDQIVLYAGIFIVASPARWIFLVTAVLKHAIFLKMSHSLRFRPWITFLIPLAAALVAFAHVRSACLALWRGKIAWRDTAYDLSELKKNSINH